MKAVIPDSAVCAVAKVCITPKFSATVSRYESLTVVLEDVFRNTFPSQVLLTAVKKVTDALQDKSTASGCETFHLVGLELTKDTLTL